MDVIICASDTPVVPPSEPTCCPDAYYCPRGSEVECPRHGGFDVCCDGPHLHLLQDREAWHRQMWDWEQELLSAFLRHGATVILGSKPDPIPA
jgi:hypothetical protein